MHKIKLLHIILLTALLLILCACTDSMSSVQDIHVLAFNRHVTLECGTVSEPMYLKLTADGEYQDGDIKAISENPDIAHAEFYTHMGNEIIFYTINAKSKGQTNIYFSSLDGVVKSESIQVVVTEAGQGEGNDALEDAVFVSASSNDTVQSADTVSKHESTTVVPSADCTYVLNKSSGKFHLTTCSGVKTMSQKNYGEFFGTRDEAIAQGYVPCKTCKP